MSEPLLAALETRGRVLLGPVLELLDPTQRLAWPYLLWAGGMAVGVWWVRVRPAGRTSLLGFLFPAKVWLHRSALLDYRFLLLRALLAAILLPPALISAQTIAVRTALGLVRWLGPGPGGRWAPEWRMAAMTVLVFVLGDLARFLMHRMLHRVPFLWELHKVHHSAEVLTPFTLHRTHPIEAALMRGATAAALGGAAGVCAWFFQGQVSAWEILGVDALSMVWTLLGSNLRHSQVWLSFGPVLERVWLSPAQHQIHHSVDPQHHDKNFGEALAIWDALAGTLVLSGERQQLTFGLAPEERNHGDTALSLVVAPWLASVRRLLSGVSRGKVLVESLGVKR